jgi:hypothetical protein
MRSSSTSRSLCRCVCEGVLAGALALLDGSGWVGSELGARLAQEAAAGPLGV